MARVRNLGEADGGWRPLALAAAVAGAVVLLLAVSVAVIWLVGGAATSDPAVGGQLQPTPTPRALAFLRVTPAAAQPSAAADTAGELTTDEDIPAATVPALMSATGVEGTDAPINGAIFSAPDGSPFSAVASGSWDATADALRNDGTSADAEPLLTLASVPRASFAIEAEIKVNGVLDAFCNQSFGLAGGDAAVGRVYGGGVLFPCEGDAAHARLSNVSTWQDGYHADPLIAENAFDPGTGWRTYRFEVREDAVRLIVDGVGIVSGSLDAPLDDAAGAEAGVWSQGVDLAIRSIEIYPLPAE